MAKVLVVDDSIIIQKQLKTFFNEIMDYEVVAIGKDGNEAVKLYAEYKPDLVTLDITMPNKDGLEALSEIIEINSSAKVIMVSVLDDASKIRAALKLGAKTYIEKPIKLRSDEEIEELKKEIEEVINS
ncbi:response regulator [Candidatus Margulisiibacteriota bacterium]